MIHLGTLLFAAFAPAAVPDVQQIVREAINREINNQRKLDNYTWQESQVVRRVNKPAPESKVWDYFQIDGSPYRKLIEKNGKPLPASEARKEQEKMDKEIARRRDESPSRRDKRLKAEEKEKAEGIQFREEVLRAFDFKLEGEETVVGEAAWRIAGTPKSGFRPRSRDGKMLAKIQGQLWVAKRSGEWLKFEIETLDKLTFGAFLASVAPGARISSEQMRVNEELWHPKWARVRLNARALWMKFDAEIEVAFRNFQKFSAESKILETGGEAEK